MKYIRTKDGIYDKPINTFEHSWGEISWSIGEERYVAHNKEEYEKQINELRLADTIEELCDAFIIIDEDNKRNIYLKEDGWTFDMMQDLGMWSDRTCYGAIWTDKGLIFVAKMNDKGDIELL